MVNDGWLTTERSVQFTDWGAGDRIIVDFDGRPFERKTKEPLLGRSYVVERIESKMKLVRARAAVGGDESVTKIFDVAVV